MQDLFNEQLKTLKEALLYHLRSISDVDTLLSIEVRFLSLFSRFLDLCVDVRRRYERPAAPLQRGIDLRDAKLPRGAVGGHHQGQRDDVGFNARIHGRDVGDAIAEFPVRLRVYRDGSDGSADDQQRDVSLWTHHDVAWRDGQLFPAASSARSMEF